jgi:hypothetical protein
VEQFYHKQDNIPIHLAHPDASVWAMISWDTFDGLTSKEVMDLTQTQHLYITDIAASPVDFDRQALRHLKSLDAVIKIEGRCFHLYGMLFLKGRRQINRPNMGATVVL